MATVLLHPPTPFISFYRDGLIKGWRSHMGTSLAQGLWGLHASEKKALTPHFPDHKGIRVINDNYTVA